MGPLGVREGVSDSGLRPSGGMWVNPLQNTGSCGGAVGFEAPHASRTCGSQAPGQAGLEMQIWGARGSVSGSLI